MTCRIWNVRLGLTVALTVLACSIPALTNSIIDIAPGESIQDALQQAPEGAILRLLPGTHTENLRIERGITLIGDADAPDTVVLEPRMPGPAITVSPSDSAAEVTLEGFSVRGAFGYLPHGVLYLTLAKLHCDRMLIENCQGSGVVISGSGEATIERCTIRENAEYGIDVRVSDVLVSGNENRISGNGAALGGWAPPELRVPLVSQTETLILRVPGDYSSLQEAIDAIAPSGTILLEQATCLGGVTIWKDVAIHGSSQERTMISPGAKSTITLSILSSAEHVILRSLDLELQEGFPLSVSRVVHLDDVVCAGQGIVHQDPAVTVQADGSLIATRGEFRQMGGAAIRGLPGSRLDLADVVFEGNVRDLDLRGVRSATLRGCTFVSTRTESIFAGQGSLLLADCTFDSIAIGVRVEDGSLVALNCQFEAIAQIALEGMGDAAIQLASCTFAGGSDVNLVIRDTARCVALSSAITGAISAGVVAANESGFHFEDCQISDNLGPALVVSMNAKGTVDSSSIIRNGLDGIPDSLGLNVEAGGGIHVCMDGELTLRDVEILDNRGVGIVVEPSDPFAASEIQIGRFDVGTPTTYLPVVRMTRCRIERNLAGGVFVQAYGDVDMIDCTVSANAAVGIYLDSTAWNITGNATNLGSFSQTEVETDGVDVSIDQCVIEDHSAVGILIHGESRATLLQSTVRSNVIGIMIEPTSRLHLERCIVTGNASYGVFFQPVLEDDRTQTLPDAEKLTGYGNSIPGPGEQDGNGAVAFSDQDLPCLFSTTPCSE